MLQQSVDSQIQAVGFLPDASRYGMNGADSPHHPRPTSPSNGNGHHEDEHPSNAAPDAWTCSDKQKELVLKLVEQHGLEKKEVEALAKEMFGLPVKTLNRLQASGLIEELLARYGKATKNGQAKAPHNGSYQRRSQPTRS